MNRILTLLLSIFFTIAAFGQPALTVHTDRQVILIGEPLLLEWSVSGPAPVAPLFIDSIPFFEIMEREKVDTTKQGSIYTVSGMLKLTSWDSGMRQIPAFAHPLGSKSKAINISVRFSSPFDANQPYHGERDIMDVEAPTRDNWPWYIALALILIAIAALLFPKKRNDGPRPVKVDLQLYKKILQRLQQLQQNEAARAQPKQFYTDAIVLLRQYLRQRKGYYSDSETTADLVTRLPRWRLSEKLQSELSDTLTESDLVKFARYEPDASDMDRAVQVLKQAVIAIEEAST
jgi:hypothetical protein